MILPESSDFVSESDSAPSDGRLRRSHQVSRVPESAIGAWNAAQARALVRDLFEPRPWIYWTDFLVSLAIGYGSFAAIRFCWWDMEGPLGLRIGLGLLAFVPCVFALFRASIFVHEIAHLPSNQFRAFRFVWNLLAGVPMLVPSFTYKTHLDHHRADDYGTDRDGEYLPLATQGPWAIGLYLAQVLFIPILLWIRWGILAPIRWMSPPLWRWVQRRASSLVMNPLYVRDLRKESDRREIFFQELGCFLFVWGTVAAGLIVKDRFPYPYFATAYLVGVAALLVNHLRTIAAHRYASGGAQMTFADQMLDSINLDPRWWFVYELIAPVGTRYHALHHLFPKMPYHAFPEAHRRLTEGLPADSPYHATTRHAHEAIAELWAASRQAKSRRLRARQRVRAAQSGWPRLLVNLGRRSRQE
ncbi:MAG TPA: fatty acid desaturase [Pirellulaceae bacterium]|jgi:fatty acid desaturase|nr:fatty acid desaturase [Pirellulaceae bacterium]